MMRFSPHPQVNREVERIIMKLGETPYTMTIPDIIDLIRVKFSDRAARSIKITVH